MLPIERETGREKKGGQRNRKWEEEKARRGGKMIGRKFVWVTWIHLCADETSQTMSEPGDAKLRSILLNHEETWLALELVCAELIVWTMFHLPISEQTWPT